MAWESIAMALVILVAPSFGYAEPVDKTSPSQRKDSPISSEASYFQGVWNGGWEGERGEVTVVIGVMTSDGSHSTGFSSGMGRAGDGTTIFPFSITTTGREEGGVYTFDYKGAYGYKRNVTLKKYKDNMVKIRLEWEGPTMPSSRPAFWETYLSRI
jgi:hypothetical protein